MKFTQPRYYPSQQEKRKISKYIVVLNLKGVVNSPNSALPPFAAYVYFPYISLFFCAHAQI